MTRYTLSELTRLYDAYVDVFRGADGQLPPMMRLKRTHTAFVVRNAEAISEGESFDAQTRECAIAAALLHDTGRYEQLRRYDTFKDSDSVDHAVFSHDIVREKGWLDQVGFAAEDREVVLKSVLYHNRRDLPADLGTGCLCLAAHAVRDADKLDIFRVLEDQVRNTDWKADSRAFWNLAVSASPNPVVIANIERGEPVDYQDIQSLSDFVLIQVGWMISGLHFATARRLCEARGHLAYRRAFLHQLTSDPSIDRLCDLAAQAVALAK